MGMLDVKIEVARSKYWKSRNQRLERLKSVVARDQTRSFSRQSSDGGIQLQPAQNISSSGSSFVAETNIGQDQGQGEVQSRDLPYELYQAAGKDDVDSFIDVLEKVSIDNQLAFSDILQLVSPTGNTLLHVAVINICLENVKLLLFHSPALMLVQNLVGDTPIHLAVRTGDYIIKAFRDFINYKNYKRQPDFEDLWIRVVGTIPQLEHSIRIRNRNGNTVLHEAAIQSDDEALFTFAQQDPEACYILNNQAQSVLFLVAQQQSYLDDVFQCLRQEEFQQQRLKGLSPLLPIVRSPNKGLIDSILKHEISFISLLDKDGKTPLHHAASIDSVDMVKYILGKKAEYALVRDINGFLPIHTAAAHGSIEVIRQLLQYGQGPMELLTLKGQNIFHIAAARGRNNAVCFILGNPSLECLINEGDVDGNTPLHLATSNWHAKVVYTMTWDTRVNLGCVNRQGFTPLDAVEYYMESPPSFDKRLTWTALKAAGAPYCAFKLDASNKSGPRQSSKGTDTMSNYKDRVNTLLVVATLVATVTFAAGFTMPGGYDSSDPNKGMATMLRNKAFHVFIFSDTIAMYSSILVAICLIWAQLGDVSLILIALRVAIPLLGAALSMMSLAFVAGVYLVVGQLHWLAYTVLITGLTFLAAILLLFFPLHFPLSSRCRILRYFSYYPFHLLMWLTSNNDHKAAD